MGTKITCGIAEFAFRQLGFDDFRTAHGISTMRALQVMSKSTTPAVALTPFGYTIKLDLDLKRDRVRQGNSQASTESK